MAASFFYDGIIRPIIPSSANLFVILRSSSGCNLVEMLMVITRAILDYYCHATAVAAPSSFVNNIIADTTGYNVPRFGVGGMRTFVSGPDFVVDGGKSPR
jgi:hypothetical protein